MKWKVAAPKFSEYVEVKELNHFENNVQAMNMNVNMSDDIKTAENTST